MINENILIIDEEKIENDGEDMIATISQIYFNTFNSVNDAELIEATYNEVWNKHEFENHIITQENIKELKLYEQYEQTNRRI